MLVPRKPNSGSYFTMTKHKLNARLGATAIAAVLALSSTPLLAQQATTDTTQTAPTATTDTAPATTDTAPAATTDTTTAVPDSSSTTTVETTTTAKPPAVHHSASAARSVTTTHVARAATTARAAPVAAAPLPVAATPAAVPPPAPAPTVAPPLAQVAGPPPAAQNSNTQQPADNRTAEMIGGALFLAIVLGALAYALSRRRTRETVYEEEAYEPETSHEEAEPVHAEHVIAEEQPAIVAPEASAFSWGRPEAGQLDTGVPAAAPRETVARDDGDDRWPGESWVDRAYRGPSTNNPSLSLRKRLKRAAFFDSREREAAEGRAESVDTTAGLPEAAIDERELTDA